jgi:hypothetical protein
MKTVASTLCLLTILLLSGCRDKETAAPAAAAPVVIGEDGRYDCGDTTITAPEGAQWAILKRGFGLVSLDNRDYPAGSYEVRMVRREPTGPELLLHLTRQAGHDQMELVKPRNGTLHADFVEKAMKNGTALPDLWTPAIALDTFVLADSLTARAIALIEARGLTGITSMRRCDTATHTAAPLEEAVFVIDLKGAKVRRTAILRPGHYADTFWNDLQKLFDAPGLKNPGPGF